MAEYKGFTGDVYKVIANSGNSGAVNNIVNGPLINNQSPLAEAQRQADLRSKLQQKRPVVFEYPYVSNGKVSWKSVELYINPERLSMSTQKIKGKQVGRGGIYYHHWGDDHYSLQLSGTTGLSGMKGIEQLEDIYHASGSLLRYTKFGPEKTQLNDIKKFEIIEFSDPVGALSTIKENIGSTKMDQLKVKITERIVKEQQPAPVMWDKTELKTGQTGRLKITKRIEMHFYQPGNKTKMQKRYAQPGSTWRVYGYKSIVGLGGVWNVGGGWYIKNIRSAVIYQKPPQKLVDQIRKNQAQIARAKDRSSAFTKNQGKILKSAVDMYLAGMYNIDMADKIAQAGSDLYLWEEDYKKTRKARPSNQAFYQYALSVFNRRCKGLSSELKIQLAYQHTQSTYGYIVDDVKSFAASAPTKVNVSNDPYRIADFEGSSTYLDTGYNNSYIDSGVKPVKGQTGVVQVLKPIMIYRGRPGSSQLAPYRQAKPGESLKTFGYRSTHGGQYDLGNNLYITNKSGYIRFIKLKTGSQYPEIPEDDVAVKTAALSVQRAESIKKQIDALEQFYKNESRIREQLRSSALGMISTMEDQWLPRNVICYFENRAYVGTFDTFSYQRVANTPLISYELRFTVTKQIVGQI